ncbi:uncharacterized protein [Palaemon carinicauda]|uniref:uncharacterized protein n=1 Tax=Palaemon carinicauda TaxID=392227 RepID=UPI0035B64C26
MNEVSNPVAHDYRLVEALILKAFERVPEAYRQKFRNLRKGSESYAEYWRQMKISHDRLVEASLGNNKTYSRIIELIGLEQFLLILPTATRQYIEDRNITYPDQAAVMADEYTLKEKISSYSGSGWCPSSFHPNQPPKQFRSNWSPRVPAPSYPPPGKGVGGNPTHGSAKNTAAAGSKGNHGPGENKSSNQNHERDDQALNVNEVMRRQKLCQGMMKKRDMAIRQGQEAFIHAGSVSLQDQGTQPVQIRIMCDTGAEQSVLQRTVLPFDESSALGETVVVRYIRGREELPLYEVNLSSSFISGTYPVTLVDEEPMQGKKDRDDVPTGVLAGTFLQMLRGVVQPGLLCSEYSRESLIEAQKQDSELARIRDKAESLSELEVEPSGYYLKDDVLMHKWRPKIVPADAEWTILYQAEVPPQYREEILRLAHEQPMGGHLGVRKTREKVSLEFCWPNFNRRVAEYCRSCHSCQVISKKDPNHRKAPLQPIPVVEEPFSKIIMDIVGPLPKTKKGHTHLLMVMCVSTRFPEAYLLRAAMSQNVSRALVQFVTTFGLPKIILTGKGSVFMSKVFEGT